MYLFNEQNLISEHLLISLVKDLRLDSSYMIKTLSDNNRYVSLTQELLF